MRGTDGNESQRTYAEKWGTTQKTISLMMNKGCDFDAPDVEVAKWLLEHMSKKPRKMMNVINAIIKPATTAAPPTGETRSLEQMRDYYRDQLDAVTQSDHINTESIKFWNDLLLKTDESIRRSEAHAKKLGIDKGELLSRSEVERIFRAMLWAGNACCDKFAKQIAQRLSNKPPEEIYEMLAPMLTACTLFEGMRKITKPPGECNVPEWLVDCVNQEESQYLDDE